LPLSLIKYMKLNLFGEFSGQSEYFRKNTIRSLIVMIVSSSFIFVLTFIFLLLISKTLFSTSTSLYYEMLITFISALLAFLISSAGIYYNYIDLRHQHWKHLVELRNRADLADIMLNDENEIHYFTDKTGNLLWVSAGVISILGYQPQDVLGKPLSDYYFDTTRRKYFLKALQEHNGIISGYEEMMLHQNGSTVWVSTNARYYKNEDGVVSGVVGSARNITDQKLAKEALSENEMLFRLVSDNSPDGLMIYDHDTKIIYANPSLCKITGYSREEISRLTIWDLIHPEIAAEARGNLEKRFVGDRNAIIYENFRIIRKGGTEVLLKVRSQGVEYKGRFAVFVQCSEIHGEF
jgi:PAS domain S-box-containing protein